MAEYEQKGDPMKDTHNYYNLYEIQMLPKIQ